MKYNKGVIYYTFGDKFPNDLETSVKSVRKNNPNLPIAWITENYKHKKSNIFDIVIESKSTKKYGWHKRTESLLLTPFDNTLHLDSDTFINGKLDYGFEKSNLFNIAICHAPAYYAKTFINTTSKSSLYSLNEDQILYNAGVIFFKKNDVVWELFNKWISYNDKCVTEQDQCGLSNAIEELNINPFILSKSWNFRGGLYTEGHGPIKIWHSHNVIPKNKINQKGFFKI